MAEKKDEGKDKGKVFKPEIVDLVPIGDALQSLVRGEIDMQIATAKKYPRSIEKFKQKVRDLAMLDKETAAECRYALPRGGKTISGPSVRWAEIVAASYGNIRVGSRVIAIDDKFVVAQGVAHDLEANYATTEEVRRRITKSDGTRYNDDMIMMTANAACAVARRNATFVIVPKALTKQVFDETMQLALGDGRSLGEQRKTMFDYWKSIGILKKQILAVLGRTGIADVTMQDVADMRSLQTAISNGITTLELAFSPQAQEKAPVEAAQTDGEEALKKAKASIETNKTPGETKPRITKEDLTTESAPGIEDEPKEPEKFICPNCGKDYGHPVDLKDHICPGPKKPEKKQTVKERLIAELTPYKENAPADWLKAVSKVLGLSADTELAARAIKSFTQRELQSIKNALATLEKGSESAPAEPTEQSQAGTTDDAPEADSEAPETGSEPQETPAESVNPEEAERAKYCQQIRDRACSIEAKERILLEVIWKRKPPSDVTSEQVRQLAENPEQIQNTAHLKSIAQTVQYMPADA